MRKENTPNLPSQQSSFLNVIGVAVARLVDERRRGLERVRLFLVGHAVAFPHGRSDLPVATVHLHCHHPPMSLCRLDFYTPTCQFVWLRAVTRCIHQQLKTHFFTFRHEHSHCGKIHETAATSAANSPIALSKSGYLLPPLSRRRSHEISA